MFHQQGIITLLNLDLNSLSAAKNEERIPYEKRLFRHVQGILKKTVSQKDFREVMETLADKCRHNRTLVPYLEKTVFLVYDSLPKDQDPFMKDFMDAKLISIFFNDSPTSLEYKKKLLDVMKNMEYLTGSHLSASIILRNMSIDYVRRKQYMGDANFSYVSSLGQVIDTMAKGQKRYAILTNQDRTALREALTTLKKAIPCATNPLIKAFKQTLKPIPAKNLLGTSSTWFKTALGEAPNATRLERVAKRGSQLY